MWREETNAAGGEQRSTAVATASSVAIDLRRSAARRREVKATEAARRLRTKAPSNEFALFGSPPARIVVVRRSVIQSCEDMQTREIVLPITEPETEWVRGRAVQKLRPKRDHSRVQIELGMFLAVWSRGRGEVGSEWRFHVAVAGEPRRPLAPDIAFVAVERLRGLTHEEIQAPAFAPTVAIEILSPGDDPLDIASKVVVYLGGGSALVIVVEPKSRTMTLHDALSTTSYGCDDTVRHGALPGFELPLQPFFARALDLPI